MKNEMLKVKYFLMSIFGLFLGIPIVRAATPTGFSNPMIETIVNLLNDIAHLIGNDAEITKAIGKAGPGGTAPQAWVVVGLTFVLVTATIAAALQFVKIFEKRKGASIIIAVMFGIAACAAPGIMSMVWSASYWMIVITFIALIIFIARIIWSSGSAGAAGVSKEAAEANAQLYDAKKQKDAAKQDFNIQKELIDRENRGIHDAQSELDSMDLSGNDVVTGLKNLIEGVQHVSKLRDEGQSLKMKESLQRQAGVIAAKLTHEDETKKKLFDELGKIKGVLKQQIELDANADKNLEQLKKYYHGKKGTAVAANSKEESEMGILANKMSKAVQDELRLEQQLEQRITEMDNHNQKVKQHIQNVVAKMYENDYPGAITEANSGINEEQASRTARSKAKELFAQIQNLENECNKFETYLRSI